MRAKLAVNALPERTQYKGGGRGYYRNISLLSVWAIAPFMHNNAIGPELCGPTPPSDPSWDADGRRNLYRSPYVATAANGSAALDANGNPLSHPNPPRCWPYDASVEGRFALFRASMQELFNPSTRLPKITRLAEAVVIPVGPRYVFREGLETGLDVRMPAGMAAARLANLRYKELIEDLVVLATNPDGLDAALAARWEQPDERAAVAAVVRDVASDLAARPDNALEILRRPLCQHSALLQQQPGARRERGPQVRRGSVRGREGRSDGFPCDVVRPGETSMAKVLVGVVLVAAAAAGVYFWLGSQRRAARHRVRRAGDRTSRGSSTRCR